MKYTIDQQFRCASVARFVDEYFSEAFNNAVAPVVGLSRRELIEMRELEDGQVERRVRMEPTVQLPRAVRRLIGDRRVTYDEVSLYDPRTQTARYRIDSAVNDHLDAGGQVRFVDDGPGRVRRIIDADVRAHVPGLSTLIERLIEREVKKSYEQIAAFMQRWLDEHP